MTILHTIETHTILEAQFEAGIRAHRNSVLDFFSCSRTLRLWLCTLALILFAAGRAIAGPRVDVVVGPKAPELERFAATELGSQFKQLFDAEVKIAEKVPARFTHLILVG